MRRPRYIVRSRNGRDVVGVWYDLMKQSLCVGGPTTCDWLAQEVLRYYCENAIPKVQDIRIPVRVSGDRRFRRQVGFSEKEFKRLSRHILERGVELLDAIVEPVQKFGRLTQ